MTGPRPRWSLLAITALLAATPALAACGTRGGAGGPLPYVAEFPLGADTPEARQFVLTPTPGPGGPAVEPGVEPGVEPDFGPAVVWVDDGRYLGVVTYGSSGCPSGPHGIDVVADQEIHIRLGELFPDREVCTADMAGHVTVVELPAGVTPTRPLVARFGAREVTLAAVG